MKDQLKTTVQTRGRENRRNGEVTSVEVTHTQTAERETEKKEKKERKMM